MDAPPPSLIDRLQARFPGLQAVYLFGSAASGALRPDSDIDLAILAGKPVSHADLLEARAEAEELCRRDVDLIDLAAAKGALLGSAPPQLAFDDRAFYSAASL